MLVAGVLAILDEQCKLGVDHFNFAEKLFQSFVRDKKKHDPTGRFAKPKVGRETFMIRHYAGSVTYSSDLFLEKNKEFVVPEHQRLLGEVSSSAFVRELFKPATPAESGGRKRQGFTFLSVGSTFKSQLQALMDTLSKTEPHYIRCIKPNSKNKPSIFEKANVLHQLRCGGVLEAIRISCAGYPTRKPFEEFLDRFLVLAPDLYGRSGTEKELVGTLLSRYGCHPVSRMTIFKPFAIFIIPKRLCCFFSQVQGRRSRRISTGTNKSVSKSWTIGNP